MRASLLLTLAASCEGLQHSPLNQRRSLPLRLTSTANYADFSYSAAGNAAAATEALALAAAEATAKAKEDLSKLAAPFTGLLTGSEPAPLEIPASRTASSWQPLNSFKYASVKDKVVAEHTRLVALAAAKTGEGSTAEAAAPDETPGPFLAPLFRFDAAHREETLERWERIDDVIMGGISTSQLVAEAANPNAVAWCGVVRPEGGGFCGQRSKLLTSPLDLSAFEGIYVTCRADAQADRKVWKMSLRTQQDRGEVIYSAELPPLPRGGGLATVLVPFSGMRLVRGPRLVPNAPPVDPKAVFQISMTCTKFLISTDGATLDTFLPGAFRLELAEIGAFAANAPPSAPAAAAPASSAATASSATADADAVAVPAFMTAAAQKAARPLPLKVLAPLARFVFSEPDRRRALAWAKLRKPRALMVDVATGEVRAAGGLARTRVAAFAFGWAVKRRRVAARAANRATRLFDNYVQAASPARAGLFSALSADVASLVARAVAAGAPLGTLAVAAVVASEAARDFVRLLLTLPLRLAFKAAFAAAKAAKAAGAKVNALRGVPAEPALKLPPL